MAEDADEYPREELSVRRLRLLRDRVDEVQERELLARRDLQTRVKGEWSEMRRVSTPKRFVVFTKRFEAKGRPCDVTKRVFFVPRNKHGHKAFVKCQNSA